MFSHVLRKFRSFLPRSNPVETRTIIQPVRVWHVLPELTVKPDWDAWISHPSCVVIKKNLQRTIYRTNLGDQIVYAKVTRVNTPRAWLRELVRLPKSQLEFENALHLFRMGIHTTIPLAWGRERSRGPGASYLVTKEVANARPWNEVVEELLTKRNERHAVLISEFARFVARIHDAGVIHPDPHAGNILVDLSTNTFSLMDVHSVHFGKPADWPTTRENLTLINRWYQIITTRTDRHWFWKHYTAARKTLELTLEHARELEIATHRSNCEFWNDRIARYTGNNRISRKIRVGPLRGYASNEYSNEALRTWLEQPDAIIDQPGVKVLKNSASATVIDTMLGTQSVIWKKFKLKKRFASVRNLLRTSPALRSWILGYNLIDRGIPTAKPLMMVHRYRDGLPAEGYTITEKVPNALELNAAVVTVSHDVLKLWIDRLARMIRTMHEREVSHRDLKAANILMQHAINTPIEATPVLIDLVGVNVGKPVSFSQRCHDLSRLAASFINHPNVSRTDLLRFLKVYIGNDRHWKHWWKFIAGCVRQKVARNQRTGRPLM